MSSLKTQKQAVKVQTGFHESGKQFMKPDQGLLDHPDEDSQIRERIWSILEVMRGLKNRSREIPSTVTQTAAQ
jgi:hypothetical protein